MATVDFNTIQPFKSCITDVADLGVNIQCIDKHTTDKYKLHLLKDRHKSKVRTSDGYIDVQCYELIHCWNVPIIN